MNTEEGRLESSNYDEGSEWNYEWNNWPILNADPSLLTFATKDGDLIFRNLLDGTILKKYRPDGQYLVPVVSQNIFISETADLSTVTGFDLNTGRSIFTINEPGEKYFRLTLSQDGSLFLMSTKKQVGIWKTKDGTKLTDMKGLSPSQYGIKMSPDGKTLASYSGDTLIKLWDIRTGNKKRNLQYTSAMYEGVAVDWSQDSKTLVSASKYGFKVWNAETGAILYQLDYGGSMERMKKYHIVGGERGPEAVAFSPDGSLVAVFDGIGTIFIFDYKNDRLVKQLDIPIQSSFGGFDLKFSMDGKYLFSSYNAFNNGGNGRFVQVWGVTP